MACGPWRVPVHSDAVSFRLMPLENGWVVIPGASAPQFVQARQLTELNLAVAHRCFSELFCELWQPELLCFSHRAPRDLSSHRRVFGLRLQFGAAVTGFVCSKELTERRRAMGGLLLARDASAQLDERLAVSAPGTAAAAREIIARLLPTGLCSTEAVSERLGLRPRTLRRHLVHEGTTYGKLIDEVRQDASATTPVGRSELCKGAGCCARL